MQREQRGEGAAPRSTGRQPAAQREAAPGPGTGAVRPVADSPRVAAQRQQIQRLFGAAAQLRPAGPEIAASAPAADSVQRAEDPAPGPNRTGLPDALKSGVESLSGLSLDHVKVHYNSAQPAQLNALAYAQGSDIHVAPGQEKHLPHEAWHVVQQMQGRVRPTLQMKGGIPVNDDAGLEKEADSMGEKASRGGLEAFAQRMPRESARSSGNGSNGIEGATGTVPVQMALGTIEAGYFCLRHSRHPGVAGWAIALGSDWANAENIYNLGVHISAATQEELSDFIGAGGSPADFTGLTALAAVALPHGTVAAMTDFLKAVVGAGGAVSQATALVNAAGNKKMVSLENVVASFSPLKGLGWSWAAIHNLIVTWESNGNGLQASHWVTVAQRMGQDKTEETRLFCGLAGWDWESIDKLTKSFAANANALPVNKWVEVAGRVPNKAADDASAFCQMNGWSWQGISELTKGFLQNANGLRASEWMAVAGMLDSSRSHAAVLFCQLAGWTGMRIKNLVMNFLADNNGLSAANWVVVAERVGNGQVLSTVEFCQLAGWTWTKIKPLTEAFKNDCNGLSVQQWSAIAGRMGAARHADVIEFCQLAGWSWAGIDELSLEFCANPGALSAAGWAEIATAHNAIINKATAVIPLARVQGWTSTSLASLASAYGADPGACTADQWASLARAHANLANKHGDVAEFARVANWSAAHLAALAQAYGADRGGRTAGQWAAIASAHASLQDRETDVARFARIPGWTPANLVTLAALYGANAGVCNAQQWAAIARSHANYADQEACVADLARMAGWNPNNIELFARGALQGGLGVNALRAFLGTANAVAQSLALVNDWGAGTVGSTLAAVRCAAGAPTDAQTVQLFQLASTNHWTAQSLARAAAGNTCGAPNWIQVLAHVATFIAAPWAGAAGAGGMGGAVLVINDFTHATSGRNVGLYLTQGRLEHVRNGHSYDRFDFAYANCVRNGVGGTISFYAAGTNVQNTLDGHVNSVAGQNLADSVAAHYVGVNPPANSFLQGNMGGDRVGMEDGGIMAAGRYPIALTQCYPTAGTSIVGRDLVAIGRLLGNVM